MLLVNYLRAPEPARWKQAVFTALFLFDRARMLSVLCGSGSTAPRRTRCPARSATRLGELSPPVAAAGIVAWTGTEPAFFDLFTAFPLAAVRLHGRNARKWWRHDHAEERYDYHYPTSSKPTSGTGASSIST